MINNGAFVDFSYEIVGNGKETPIVFLHGWGGDKRSFLYFSKTFQDRKCVLVEFPPFGESSEPRAPLSVFLYAKLLIQILEKNDIKDFYIVAHSFGARVAVEMCKLGVVPQKMVITGGAGIKKKKSLKTKIKIVEYKFTKYLCECGLLNFNKLKKFGSSDYMALSSVSKATFVNIINYDQTKYLRYVSCPVLLYWGKKDKETPFYFTKIYKKHIKDCGVVCAVGGHFAYLENAGEFLRLLHEFLK